MAAEAKKGVEAEREPNFLLAPLERRFLPWAAGRLPRAVLPDDMTALGVLAAFGVCAAYQLSNEGNAWLWVASGLLVVQWLGDSLDGEAPAARAAQAIDEFFRLHGREEDTGPARERTGAGNERTG